jgi:hypothetical protein
MADTTSIALYYNGTCKANEFIEDDSFSFNSDGTIHYIQFVEGSLSINFDHTAFYAAELSERFIVYLTNESDEQLVDESGNYLVALI